MLYNHEMNPMGIGFGSFKTHSVRCVLHRNPERHNCCLPDTMSGVCCYITGSSEGNRVIYTMILKTPDRQCPIDGFFVKKMGWFYEEIFTFDINTCIMWL